MVRPERGRVWTARPRCYIRLAGESPAAVSAGAPRSRLQAPLERAASKRSVKSPAAAVGLQARGANQRAECEKRELCSPVIEEPERGSGRARHDGAKARDCAKGPERRRTLLGYGRRHAGIA